MKKVLAPALLAVGGLLVSHSVSSGVLHQNRSSFAPMSTCTATVTSGNPVDLQNALTAAQSNGRDDVICVQGTYNLTFGLSYSPFPTECGKSLTIKAIGNGAVLDGIRISPNPSGGINKILSITTTSCGENATAGSIVIEGIKFQNGKNGGLSVGTYKDSIMLINNVFVNNTYGGQFPAGGGASVSSWFGSITIVNNIFKNNRVGGFATAGGGLDVFTMNGSITIANNTFKCNTVFDYNNTGTGAGGGVSVFMYNDIASLHFYNNILWDNGVNQETDDLFVQNDGNNNNIPSAVNIAHNLFTTTQPAVDFSTAPQTGSVYIRLPGNYNQNIANGCANSGQFGNIQQYPMFVDTELRLGQNSPAINAGCNNAPGLPQTDKDGNQRIIGSAVDMGAYEHVSPGNNPGNPGNPGNNPGNNPPGTNPGTAGGGGGGGGCSMGASTNPVNGLLWLLAPAMVLLRRVRKK